MTEGSWSGRARHRTNGRRNAIRQPLAVGWGMPDVALRSETVVANFDRDRLSAGLARLHGHGFGAAARVLDSARGDLGGQLSRLGLPPELIGRLAGGETTNSTTIVVVNAAARSEQVAVLLGRAGAIAVEIVRHGDDSHAAESVLDLPADAATVDLGA